MKFIILSLFLFVLGTQLSGQTVSYGYDAAGNRISRVIEMTSLRSQEQKAMKQPKYSEIVNKVEVGIYPNPTEGLLKVELRNLDPKQTANILLYSLSGKLIVKKEHVSAFSELDISNQVSGMYILKITSSTFQSEWKIIKK